MLALAARELAEPLWLWLMAVLSLSGLIMVIYVDPKQVFEVWVRLRIVSNYQEAQNCSDEENWREVASYITQELEYVVNLSLQYVKVVWESQTEAKVNFTLAYFNAYFLKVTWSQEFSMFFILNELESSRLVVKVIRI